MMNTLMTALTENEQQQWLTLAERVDKFEKVIDEWAPKLVSSDEQGKKTFDAAWQKLRTASSYLNRQSYPVSLIGPGRVGKSTLINALIGNNLIATGDGGAVTDKIITVQSNTGGDEVLSQPTASPIYYDRVMLGDALSKNGNPHTRKVLTAGYPLSNRDIEAAYQSILETKKIPCPIVNNQSGNDEIKSFCSDCGCRVSAGKCRAESLEQLLDAAKRHLDKLDQKQAETLPMGNAQEVQRVQALMKGKADPKEEIPTELISEIRLTLKDSPFPADLTDIPGAGAGISDHEEKIREHLDPKKSGAIILVLDPRNPYNKDTQELLRMIQPILGTKERRRFSATRIFLVISQRDAYPLRDQESQERFEENLRKTANQISETFYDIYRETRIFDSVMAMPGLVAKLIQTGRYSEQQGAWEAGVDLSKSHEEQEEQRLAWWPFPVSYAADEYEKTKQKAEEKTGKKGEEAVLEWSQLSELNKALLDFLSRSRWQIELQSARQLYNEAYTEIKKWYEEEWAANNANKKPSRDPRADLEYVEENLISIYRERLDVDLAQLQASFGDVCANFSQREPQYEITSSLRNTLDSVVEDVKQSINDYTKKEEFRTKVFVLSEDPTDPGRRFMTYNFEAITELSNHVLGLFDKKIDLISSTITRIFWEALRSEVEPLFERLFPKEETKSQLDKYHAIFLQNFKVYTDICRGAIPSALMRLGIRSIIETNSKHSLLVKPLSDVQNNDPTLKPSQTMVAKVNKVYEDELTKMAKADYLPDILRWLFFRNLVTSQKNLDSLVGKIRWSLGDAVKTPESNIYWEYNPDLQRQRDRLNLLVLFWEELGKINSATFGARSKK